jgi:hypothetical protein
MDLTHSVGAQLPPRSTELRGAPALAREPSIRLWQARIEPVDVSLHRSPAVAPSPEGA